MLDVPFRVEDACAGTGAPVRVSFVPDGYERADPPETATVLLPVGSIRGITGASFEQINTSVCAYQPFFASAQAAGSWLSSHPGGQVFTIAEMFERPWYTYFRDTLRPLIHPSTAQDSRN